MSKQFNFRQAILTIIIPVLIVIAINWVQVPQDSLAQTSSPVETPTRTATQLPTATSVPSTSTPPPVQPSPTVTPTPSKPAPTNTPAPVPTGTLTPEPAPGLTVEIVGPAEVVIGETIVLSVVAKNIPDPGIFGYQFIFTWEDTVFSLVDGSLALNPDFPVAAVFDVGTNAISVGTSRQGNVDDIADSIMLLNLKVQANVITDPDAAPFTLSAVKLGRKGGINVPVDQVINLDVKVTGESDAGLSGNVKVEGRGDSNQAGHTVQDSSGTLSTQTDSNGNFSFEAVEAGTYTLTANSPGFLAATCTNLTHEGDTVLESVTLLAGDIDDNGMVDIVDAVAIGSRLGEAEPGQITDLNIDLIVDVLDLILMSVNFDQTSENNPWYCQQLILGGIQIVGN